MKIVSSIPGIGNLTAVTIIAETNGFELIKNKRQLVSYAGLDVREKDIWNFSKIQTPNIQAW